MSHTPGPWKACNASSVSFEDVQTITPSHVKIVDTDEQGRRRSRLVASCNMYLPEYNANAHLIAATPEMYEALKLIVDHFGDPLKVARSAIAKAEGK
jgi:hypothetical protein